MFRENILLIIAIWFYRCMNEETLISTAYIPWCSTEDEPMIKQGFKHENKWNKDGSRRLLSLTSLEF